MLVPSDIPELLKPGRTIPLPGRILVSPHGKLIWQGKKTAILSSREERAYIGVPIYFIEGSKAFGIIEMGPPEKINLEEFKKLQKVHQVSEQERKKWWSEKKYLYLYPIKLISKFDPPKEIERPKGAQVWLKAVTFKSLEILNPKEMSDEELFQTHERLFKLWKEKLASKEDLVNYDILILNEIGERDLDLSQKNSLDKEAEKFKERFSKSGFKLTFFGTKGLIEEEGPGHKFHTSILFEFKGKRLLIDYGKKNQGNLSEIKPDFVLVSHSHPDHIGGLNDSQCIVSEDTAKEIPELYKDFNIDIRTQYKSYQTFKLGPFKITPIPVLHSVKAKMHVFLVEMDEKRVLVATDILGWHSEDREKYVKDLDLAIIDGSSFSKTLAKKNVKYDEPFGHSSIINQLKNWYTKNKVKRIIITHLGKEPLSFGDEELLKKCKEIAEVPISIAKDNVVINLSENFATIYTSGKIQGRRIYLEEVLPHFKDFLIQRPLVYLTGGLVNQGSTKGDIDILLPDWLSFDMRRIIEFRIARSLPVWLRRRLHFVYDRFSTPFTNALPLYNLKMELSEDQPLKLSETEKQLREKPRDVGAIKDAEASAKEDKVELFRYFLPLKPTRGYYPEKRQTIELFIEVMENMGSYPFYSEKKYDGVNSLLHYDGKDKVIIFSEDGDEITKSLPSFVKQIKKLTNKPTVLVGEIEHWHNGKHMPRESCNGLIHRKIGSSDEELVANVYDIVYYEKDIHNLPFEERLKILDSLPFKQKTFYPPDTKIKFNEAPRLLSKNREELRKHTEFLRKLNGSEGNVAKTKDFKYNLKGIRSGMVKFHNSTVVYGKVLQVKETKVKGVYIYYFGLEKGEIKTKVEELENTFYHRVGRSFSTNIKAKIGEVLEIEGETLNAEHNLKKDFWRLSLWAPRVMGKTDRKADTIKEAIERAKKNYCFQEKEITEEGKIIYKMLPAFGSVGGKRFLAKKIVQYFPEHKTYVEPFCGGASIFFAKTRSKQEVLNDRNPEIAFALRFIRDITPEEINRLKKFDWVKRRETFEKLKKLKPKNDFARFYKFFYTRLASYGNDVVTGFSPAKEGKEIQFENIIKRTSPRLKGVKIFNKDYEEIVKKFDSKDTLFFFDPPYPSHWDRWHTPRTHKSNFDEKRFEEVLKNLKGKFILSYETEGAKQFSGFYQMRIEAPARLDWKDKREKRYELLISNFPLKKTNLYLSEEIEKLHLKEFRSTGVDEDLKNPKEREKELIADLRYLANSGFPRLKAGKKWGEWKMIDVLKYFAKIVDTLHSIGVNIKPKKKSGSWYECWKRAKKYMKTKIEKQGDPYMEYPKSEKPRRYVIQHHWRGKSVSDLTPIIIQRKGEIEVIPIAELWNEKESGKEQEIEGIEVWGKNGWEKIKKIYRHEYKKPLTRVWTKGGVVDVTQDHSLFQDGKAKRTSELNPGEKIDLVSSFPRLPEKHSVDKDFAWMFGFFLAEGSLKKSGNYIRAISFTQKDKERFKRVINLTRRYGYSYCISNDKNCYKLEVYGFQNIFKKCYAHFRIHQTKLRVAHFKKIPNFVFEWNKESKRELLEGFNAGDGLQFKKYKYSGKRIEYTNCSLPLLQGLLLIVSQVYPDRIPSIIVQDRVLRVSLVNPKHNRNKEKNIIMRKIDFRSVDNFGEKNPNYKEGRYVERKFQKQFLIYSNKRKVYDIETESHAFVAGVGEILAHNSCHSDLRIKVNNYLLGWTVMDQIKSAVKEPVTTLKLARKYDSQDIFKIDWKKGLPKLRPGIKPGYKEKYAELAAARKAVEPVEWLNVEGITPKNEVGGTKEYPGVFHIIDKGFCEFGSNKSYYHEYFFSGGRLKGRWFFRQLRPSEFRGKIEKQEVIPPARETAFRQEAPWFFIKPIDETPYIISDAAVKKKWIPPKGISALPEKIRKKIPKEFEYWKFEDEKKRIEIRDALVEKLGKTLIEKKLNPGALWAKAAYRYVLSKQILNLWLRTSYPEKIERVRNALKEFKQLEPFKKEWLDDAIAWLEARPNDMKAIIINLLDKEKLERVEKRLDTDDRYVIIGMYDNQ